MRVWLTEFWAISAITGELTLYGGPPVHGINRSDAQRWCNENASHLTVIGELIEEIPCVENTYIPDWDNAIRYDLDKLN